MHNGIDDKTDGGGLLSGQFQANLPVRADNRDPRDIVAKGTVEGILSRLIIEDDHAYCPSSLSV